MPIHLFIGQRPDGSVFFFVDSEPMGYPDESPPGQTYDEISDRNLLSFNKQIALTSGPTKDRWGTWISAMVPLLDLDTKRVVAVLGMECLGGAWRTNLLWATLPSILLALCMALTWFWDRFVAQGCRHSNHASHRRQYREIILAVAVLGVFSSVSFAMVWGNKIGLDRERAFGNWRKPRWNALSERFPHWNTSL